MRTRPHIVTQTCVYDTCGLYRNANLIAEKMGTADSLKNALRDSRVLIRIMKIILDLTLNNNCFIVRREVLKSPRLRAFVTDRLGGAPALEKWRRREIWNKARLAAIASGEYVPAVPIQMQRSKPEGRRAKAQITVRKPARKRIPARTAPAGFRLPVLQNLRYVPRVQTSKTLRATPQTRYPSIVLWPHELDGQYVPNFKSRARRPDPGGYGPARMHRRASGHTAPVPGAPP